ncbi:MAG: hypothetical protein COS89_08300 [Deltaproteobacteria bacterium CG07_land_8_20_14_0_80_38_7]|nr:MAG: hypothetical protein COS89_08300 [Deltaproteobacteria bacterium CG07_land_8_20_14_0_80_38_7]
MFQLLRVPGIGEITVNRIMQIRKAGGRIRSLSCLGIAGKRLKKTQKYVMF